MIWFSVNFLSLNAFEEFFAWLKYLLFLLKNNASHTEKLG